MLLDANANPNLKSDLGATPLSAAAEKGYLEICKMLISANADPDIQNSVCYFFSDIYFCFIDCIFFFLGENIFYDFFVVIFVLLFEFSLSSFFFYRQGGPPSYGLFLWTRKRL